jgi:nitrogen regulatory protein PII
MKRVEAIVRPERLDAVKEAIIGLGHKGLTVTEVKGHGTQGGISQHWRGAEYVIDLLPKVSIAAVVNDHEVTDLVEVSIAAVVNDHEVTDLVDAIVKVARTDRIGDGKIFVSTIEEVIRVRTGETGPEAL